MKICLIGKNLSNFVLARDLLNKNLEVDIIYKYEPKKKNNIRTLAISKANYSFLKKIVKNLKLYSWPVNGIKIYNDQNKDQLFHFKKDNEENFFLIKYDEIFNSFFKSIKKSKNLKFKKVINLSKQKNLLRNNNYNLIINSENNNEINKKYFFNKIKKNYDSFAYTAIINHKKLKNNIALQIFTKFGPLAFLPLSNTKTSIVFSFLNKNKKKEKEILELIKKYNFQYAITGFSNVEKFKLNFSMLRKYYYKNVLSFGDTLHSIHPLAGQGFNMTLRDIKILSELIDGKINLGLDLNTSLLEEFQNKTKHLNYIFGSGIDFIHNFFIFDNKFNNVFSNNFFNYLEKNKFINKYATLFADKGLRV